MGAGHAPLALLYAAPRFVFGKNASTDGHTKKNSVAVTSVDSLPPPQQTTLLPNGTIESIAPDDVADDATNYVGDDDVVGRRLDRASVVTLVPRLLRWGAAGCDTGASTAKQPTYLSVARPASNDTLAYMTALELGALVRARKVTAVELVEIFTARLKR